MKVNNLSRFEKIARSTISPSPLQYQASEEVHPFDQRSVHPDIANVCRHLFDDGHYSQATFKAFKFIDNIVKTISGLGDSGYKLMMSAFNENSPKIKLTELKTTSDLDEQLGYKFIFAGCMTAIRNPRGHDIRADPVDSCLDHLSLASALLRRLEDRTT